MFYSKKLIKFKAINHCFFSKKGGVSKGIYYSLNCGKGSKDEKNKIEKNLELVAKKIKVNKKNLITMNQSHSNKVIVINNKKKDKRKKNSDAMITKVKGLGLGVVTADCIPIILYDVKNEIIGCAHAGWKGALSGIIENTIKKFREINTRNKIFACVGPCIGKRSYEVDLKFYEKFLSKSKLNKIYFSDSKKNKKLFNLRKYVSDKLLNLKVEVDHINFDTFKEKSKFFSYRRSTKLGQKDYGRCISVISLINKINN